MLEFVQNDVSSYLDLETEDLAVASLLDKYNVTVPTNTSFLFDLNDDYKAFADFISDLYIENQEIPLDIRTELEDNIHFKTYLIVDIQKKINSILYDNSTIVFKEIVTAVNLMSFGQYYNIFENYNTYNFDNLSKLFRDYEEKLAEQKENHRKKCFNITFNHYLLLIDILSELCSINSTDILRKKLIKPTIELITESINILKFRISLDEHQINVLNNILGKFLFFFSHIPYINVLEKKADYLIEEFTFNCEKICDGYILSKNTDFAGDLDKDSYYSHFLNSFTTLICNLIYKLEENYNKEEYQDINQFKSILELYDELVEHKTIPKFESLVELKENLLENYAYIYSKNEDSQNYSYLKIIDDFIANQSFNSSNMEILCSIILYSNRIEEDKILKILKVLLEITKYENDYHEFYKLTLCDILISKLTYKRNHAIKDFLFENILSYIETNQIASHLMSIYSKIYLSLSMYYSFYFDSKSNELTKQYYYKYLCINGKQLLENEYSLVNKQILLNLGKQSIDEMKIEEIKLEDNKYIEIGSRIITQYAQDFDVNVKYNINQKLSNIVTQIFTNDGLDNELLNKHIESFISQDIFHGLVFSAVDGLCETNCKVNDLGYKKLEIPLIDNYKLRMAYSSVYEDIFTNIYEQNKEYIKQNVINLIISYLKSIPIYIDSTTNLKNIVKLQKDLKKVKNDELIFVEIYFENLTSFNNKYTYEKGDEIFKSFALKVNEIENTYRLQGPKLGFIIEDTKNYKEYIQKVKDIKIEFEKYIITPELTIAVSWGNSDNILVKSEYAMSLALSKKEKYNEFK